jgi:hypothetical protein
MHRGLLRTWLPALLLFLSCGCSAALPTGRSDRLSSASLAGRDPYDAGCSSDASTIARAAAFDPSGHRVATVELRWSARCGTAWARAVRVASASGTLVASVQAASLSNTFEHATDGEVWTDMVPAPRACATVSGGIRRSDGTLEDARASSCDPASDTGLALR